MKILIIEDELKLAEVLKARFQQEGFDVDIACDGITGEEYIHLGIYDLLILDVMLPGIDGIQLARRIRAEHIGLPVLMLTAKSSLEDRIHGLDAGADYYLTKPFDIRELIACVHALLRRQGTQVNHLTYGNTTLDLATGTLSSPKRKIRLSAREFSIMRLLLQNPAQNHPKEQILARVWGLESNAVENHVEVYIGFLRKKMAAIGSDVSIVALRRLGYHLEIRQ